MNTNSPMLSRSTSLIAAGFTICVTLDALVWLVQPAVAKFAAVAGILVITLVAFLKYPLSVTLVILFASQETTLSRQWLMSLGNQLYFMEIASIPLIVLLATLAWVSSIVIDLYKGDSAPRAELADIVQVAIGLVVVAISLAGIQAVIGGVSVTNATRQVLYPLVVFGLLVIVARRRYKAESRALMVAGALSTIALAVLGLATAVTQGDSFVFYDTATAFIAFTVMCVVFLSERLRLPHVLVLISALSIVALSNRRSVVIGMLVAVLILAVTRAGGAVRTRILVGSTVAVGALWAVAGSALALTVERLIVGLATIRGLEADVSTEEHIGDISIGLSYAIDRLGGYGANASQLPGLAAEGSRQIYVHNELLQLWLQHGVVVSALIAVAGVLLTTLAFRSSERPTGCSPADWALARGVAAAWPALLVALMTAPFFSTTGRWPALIGIMVVFLSASVTLQHQPASRVQALRPVLPPVNASNWPPRESTAS